MRLLVILLSAVAIAACSDAERDRLELTTRASYDKVTGRLSELTYDADKNGQIDTWLDMDGTTPIRGRMDLDGDGKIDRWEYYDKKGHLLKVGFSRKNDGTVDAWAYSAPGGAVERVEISSTGDETAIDRWERYDASGLIAADEDTNADGIVDKWETYVGGALATASFDENRDGRPDRRLTYDQGTLATIEDQPDPGGNFTNKADVKRPDHPPHHP